MAQVELKDVNKAFGKIDVIRNVELEINKGEFVVFVGPSGCGKSTLLRLIAGLESLTSGEIIIADRPVMDLPPSKRGIAMVFQSYALYPHMTVFHNMAFSLNLQGFQRPRSESGWRPLPRFCKWNICLTAPRSPVRWPAPACGHWPGNCS